MTKQNQRTRHYTLHTPF